MPQIVAGLYEITDRLGSGSGGIVYRGRHLRLNKAVVLKADKRSLTARPESLEREVNALKQLSHTYIPQLYDYVQENGIVYTVMDYIEGESLDKPLERGERFAQAQIVEWGCQILEALVYLHSRPPYGILHSDIKPSNIMITPQKEIRLIDFNIALALGEDGAVRVGYSQGYASPEHYGVDYTDLSETKIVNRAAAGDLGATVVHSRHSNTGSSSVSGKGVRLDVRSDIYSLGATLYHMLTGVRPDTNAEKVIPVSEWDVSPALAAAVGRAMAPNPEQRYQTAAEMLYDLEHLHENDVRTKRRKRHMAAAAALSAAALLLGVSITFIGLKQMEQEQETARIAAETAQEEERGAKEALELIGASQSALQAGDAQEAARCAAEALALETPYAAQAQKALTDALGVYELADSFLPAFTLSLPSEVLKLAMSPEGSRLAVLTLGQVTVFSAETGDRLAQLPAISSALADLVFADEDTLYYAGADGLCAYDIPKGELRWTGAAATGIALSADGSTIAAVCRDEAYATVYRASDGAVLQTVDFAGKHRPVAANDVLADPEDSLFALDSSGQWLAVSFSDGGLWVYNLNDMDSSAQLFDTSDYIHFEGGFHGQYFAFAANGGKEALFDVIDMDALAEVGGFSLPDALHLTVTEQGLWLCSGGTLVAIDPVTGEQTEAAYLEKAAISGFSPGDSYTLVAAEDNSISFFDQQAARCQRVELEYQASAVQLANGVAAVGSIDSPTVRIMRLENHAQAQFFAYDSGFAHDEARLNSAGTTVMLFRYDRFRLYAKDGAVLAETELPDAEQVCDQQYRRTADGDYLEVVYNDGTVLRYSAEDGRLLDKTQGAAPDGTLSEEFVTDRFRILSPLHGTPLVYDLESGEQVGELEAEDYLTYVTQVNGHLVTEYLSGDGSRYGLILDESLGTLAEVPNLCDVLPDGTLLVDDRRGNLRSSHIYTLDELLALATGI